MTQLPNVRLHGLGLTDDFLLQLSDRAQTARIAEARPEGYDLPPRVTLEEAVLSAWENARKLWRRHQEHDTDPWSGWVRPLLRELDLLYGPVPAAGIGLSETGDVPLHFAPAVGTGSAAQPARLDAVGLLAGQRTSPHGLMQSHLNATPGQLWGLVTNGEVLRLLRDNAQVTRPAYAEFDLGQMMRAEDARSFRVLWLLLHRSRLRGGKDSVLEGWNERSKATGARATDSLRDGVERAIEELGSGFLEANGALNAAVKDDRALIDELHRACLKMVYQLVFVFVTEDRDLLFARNEDGTYLPNAQARERAGHYLTRALREKAGALRGGAGHFDAFAGWERLVGWLRGGFAPLGLPALGSALFAEPERAELRGLKLSNRRFYAALRALSEIAVDGTRRPVNYAGLDSEELGSIYESLLELVPRVEPGPRFALMTLPGNERKTTGSYYTPAGLIELLLESALDPVIERAVQQGSTTEEKIARVRALKVIDPACGSGHFLIAAARRIGLRLAQLEENAAQPSPAAQRRATRTVIAHCIYGADINPMAVELAKVALWLEAQDAGAPLAFLDHRLRVGNSLLGATPEVMNAEDTLPRKDITAHTLHLPDDAYKALTGDDKKTVSVLKRRNKAEREEGLRRAAGAQGLFDPQENLAPLGGMLRALDKIEPSDLAHVQAQESTYRAIREHRVLQRQREQADLWCAAFVAPRLPGVPAITTGTLHAHRRNPADPTLAPALALAGELARQYRFLHPHIEFPDVFLESGGFDCVLGNPPWERIKLQEKEWFGTRVPEIAAAPNAAARTRMIAALKTERPEVHAEFQRDLRQAEAESGFIRTSRRYPLTGRGDVNTYAVFTELAYRSINPQGRVGIIVPRGCQQGI